MIDDLEDENESKNEILQLCMAIASIALLFIFWNYIK